MVVGHQCAYRRKSHTPLSHTSYCKVNFVIKACAVNCENKGQEPEVLLTGCFQLICGRQPRVWWIKEGKLKDKKNDKKTSVIWANRMLNAGPCILFCWKKIILNVIRSASGDQNTHPHEFWLAQESYVLVCPNLSFLLTFNFTFL